MRESTKFNGKRNKEANTCRKKVAERRHTKTPDYAVGSFWVGLLYDLNYQKLNVILHLLMRF